MLVIFFFFFFFNNRENSEKQENQSFIYENANVSMVRTRRCHINQASSGKPLCYYINAFLYNKYLRYCLLRFIRVFKNPSKTHSNLALRARLLYGFLGIINTRMNLVNSI